MDNIIIKFHTLHAQMDTGIDIVNISDELSSLIQKTNIVNGTLNATCAGSTGSITTIEFESGVIKDLKHILSDIAPPILDYEHEKKHGMMEMDTAIYKRP